MSPCIKAGTLDCNHCHTASGRMRFEGAESNKSCMPCHEKEVSHAAEHGHHAAGSPGNQCVACHMPMTRFAAMGRSDHSMRPPMPAATIAFKSPNACNLCHADRDAAWSDGWVRKWYPKDYQAETLHKAQLIDAARKNQWNRLPEMLDELLKKENNEVFKAALVRLVQGCPDDKKWLPLVRAMNDPSPLVRSSAASALVGRRTRQAVEALLTGTADGSRLVRIRSAAALAGFQSELRLSDPQRTGLDRALEEFRTAMKARPDDWASHANLGNLAMEQGKFGEAVEFFETSHRLEPRMVGPMVNAAIAYSNLHKNNLAERSLRRALAAEPANAAANFNLGLLLGEEGRLEGAEQALRIALKTDPQMTAAAYNLGVILAKKDLGEAVSWCRRAHDLEPGNPKYGHTLAFYLRQQGDQPAAVGVLRALLERQPTFLDARMLLGEILAEKGDLNEAERVLRDALGQPGLTPAQRAAVVEQLRAIAQKAGSGR